MISLSLLLLLLCLLISSVSSTNVQQVALGVMDKSTDKTIYFLGLGASFSLGLVNEDDTQSFRITTAYPATACSTQVLHGDANALIAVRGGCAFVDKVNNGINASLIIVGNDDNEKSVSVMDGQVDHEVYAYMISYTDYNELFNIVKDHGVIDITIQLYIPKQYDYSMIIIYILAVSSLVLGAFYSSRLEREQMIARLNHMEPPGPDDDDDVAQYLTIFHAVSFVFIASLALILIYFFMNSMIYILIGLFTLAGCESMYTVCLYLIKLIIPKRCIRPTIFRLSNIQMITLLISVGTSILWVFIRNTSDYAFILQDIMSYCLLLSIQKLIRLPNIKVASILLIMAFFYDIFWVFISPALFESSVMVTVATGGDSGETMPMVLMIPRFSDFFHHYSLLGLGDIALPGLLVSFLLRFDYKHNIDSYSYKSGYFFISVIGYSVGLLCTFLSLILMEKGQPALLYLVPCVLGSVCFIAWRRKNLSEMWDEANVPVRTLVEEEEKKDEIPLMAIAMKQTEHDEEDGI